MKSVILLIAALIILGVFIATLVIGLRIYNKARRISQDLLGTADMVKGLKDLNEKNAYAESHNPKSISGMTSIYLPKIMKDFPEFNYDEMKNKSETLLVAYLNCLDKGTIADLGNVTDEFRQKVENEIAINKDDEINPDYSCVKIHRTAISNYEKKDGKCIISFQSAVEYFYTLRKEGRVISGSETSKTQAKYETTCIYIQDRDIVEATTEAGLAINCPNCGAALSGVGAKFCSYCNSPIIPINIKAWSFATVKNITR